MADEKFDQQAFEVQRRELGFEGLIRFLRLHGSGDYTKERHQWLQHLTFDEIAASIKRREAEMQKPNSPADAPRDR
jgi:hypothetical protein